jgi:hypothetical protein
MGAYGAGYVPASWKDFKPHRLVLDYELLHLQ